MVSPNIVRPIAGFDSDAEVFLLEKAIIPASACAAFASTFSEMRLMPEMSVTEYIMQMSEGPT